MTNNEKLRMCFSTGDMQHLCAVSRRWESSAQAMSWSRDKMQFYLEALDPIKYNSMYRLLIPVLL